MWLEEAEELFKGYLPYYLLVFLPIFILVSPANPVAASHEFPVYRMQHFDLHGISRGCRSASINLEARSLTGWSTARHCVVAKLQELTIDHFRNVRSKAGALLVVLPEDFSRLSSEEKEHLLLLETAMLAQEIMIPVYFCTQTPDLSVIVDEVQQSYVTDDKSKSAAEAMLSSVAANGYQIVINPKAPSAKQDVKVATITGSLGGQPISSKVPTIVIVAYYDSFGVAPELSYGADSNGSGVAILLELIRLLSTLYSDPRTHGKFNLMFLLSGGGKLNYQGSKKWLEEQLDVQDSGITKDAFHVICLDTLATRDTIYMHVSKPPKEGTQAAEYFKQLKNAADRFDGAQIEGVHKKINLADDLLAWEHERYSIRRLQAFTLSTLKSHKDANRGTILDTRANLNVDNLVQNAQIIADALANQIFNITSGSVFGNSLKVERNSLEAWVNYLSAQPRSAQILCNKESPLINLFKETFTKYLRDVKVLYATPDKREPDFVFYDITKGTMNIYSVKPAFFDLILTLAIVIYLCIVYLTIQKFPAFYSIACSLTSKKYKKSN